MSQLGTKNVWHYEYVQRLAWFYQSQLQFVKAEPLWTTFLEIMSNDEGYQQGMHSLWRRDEVCKELGYNYLMQGKYSAAEQRLREALKGEGVRISIQRHDLLWTRAEMESLLGAALLGQAKYAEAEPLLLSGYAGLKKEVASRSSVPFGYSLEARRHQTLTEALDHLKKLYIETNKPDEAKKWQTEKEKLTKPSTPATPR